MKQSGTYAAWRGQDAAAAYADVPGFCASADLAAAEQAGFTLSPGRSSGAPEEEEDEVAVEGSRLRSDTWD